jgi:hypothetical protein
MKHAVEALAHEHQGSIPPWHYYRDAAFFTLERGRVWRLMADVDGNAHRAVGELGPVSLIMVGGGRAWRVTR